MTADQSAQAVQFRAEELARPGIYDAHVSEYDCSWVCEACEGAFRLAQMETTGRYCEACYEPIYAEELAADLAEERSYQFWVRRF